MSDKAKLPKEVVNALDDFRDTYGGYEWMVMAAIIREQFEKESHAEVVIREFAKKDQQNFVMIMQALVNGYEVEQTPEDEVRDIYNRYLSPYNGIGASAIRDCLDALNINIKGVNENE
jgi:hypothetical protein